MTIFQSTFDSLSPRYRYLYLYLYKTHILSQTSKLTLKYAGWSFRDKNIKQFNLHTAGCSGKQIIPRIDERVNGSENCANQAVSSMVNSTRAHQIEESRRAWRARRMQTSSCNSRLRTDEIFTSTRGWWREHVETYIRSNRLRQTVFQVRISCQPHRLLVADKHSATIIFLDWCYNSRSNGFIF